jgi:hypothetical protein
MIAHPLTHSRAPMLSCADFRYMATSDLFADLENNTFSTEEDSEKRIVQARQHFTSHPT